MPPPIVINERVTVPESALTVFVARASGPGGQNVNKVSSKVDLRVDLAGIIGLDESARARLRSLVATRLDGDGRLQVTSQRTRDQLRNLADACDKVRALIEQALVAPIKRRPTRPSRGAVRARLADKSHTAARKRERTRKDDD